MKEESEELSPSDFEVEMFSLGSVFSSSSMGFWEPPIFGGGTAMGAFLRDLLKSTLLPSEAVDDIGGRGIGGFLRWFLIFKMSLGLGPSNAPPRGKAALCVGETLCVGVLL